MWSDIFYYHVVYVKSLVPKEVSSKGLIYRLMQNNTNHTHRGFTIIQPIMSTFIYIWEIIFYYIIENIIDDGNTYTYKFSKHFICPHSLYLQFEPQAFLLNRVSPLFLTIIMWTLLPLTPPGITHSPLYFYTPCIVFISSCISYNFFSM